MIFSLKNIAQDHTKHISHTTTLCNISMFPTISEHIS